MPLDGTVVLKDLDFNEDEMKIKLPPVFSYIKIVIINSFRMIKRFSWNR